MDAFIEIAPSEARVVPMTSQQRFLFEAYRKRKILSRFCINTLRLSGKVRTDLLLRSFREVIRRHDALRTRLIEVSGSRAQKVMNVEECQLRSRDISDGSDDGDEELAMRCLEEFAERRWNLDEEPLFYVEILKVSERRYFLRYAIHHLIFDAIALNLMLREIWAVYAALLRGRLPTLPVVPFQYSDYAIQQQRTEADWSDKHDLYWRARLHGATRVSWPADEGTPGLKTCATAVARAPIDVSLILRLREFARRERTLLSLVMLATCVATVSARCHQKDFVVPMVVNGRNSAEEGTVVGYLAHFIYLRMELTGDERFVDLLHKVKCEFNQALLHQDSGRVSVWAPELLEGMCFSWNKWNWEEFVGVPTSAEYINLDLKVEMCPGLPADFKPIETEGPPELLSEMTFSFLENGDGVTLFLFYRADLYSATAAGRVLAAIPTISARLLQSPYARLSTLALDSER